MGAPASVQGTPAVSSATSMLSGSLSGMATSALTQPLDVLRTEMQRSCRGKTKPHLTTYLALQHVLATRGYRGLWCGLVPTIWRVGVGMGVYFYGLSALGAAPRNSSSPAQKPSTSSLALFSSGFISRAMASFAVHPLTVIKTRFEAGDRSFGQGVIRNLIGIARTEQGVRGLFRGIVPTMLRDAPFSGIYVLLYTRILLLVNPPSTDGGSAGVGSVLPRPVITFMTGILAGTLGTVITNPADLVRTRMQLRDGPHGATGIAAGAGPHAQGAAGAGVVSGGGRPFITPKGLLQVTWEIGQSEGVMVFFTRGIAPRVLKRSKHSLPHPLPSLPLFPPLPPAILLNANTTRIYRH
jgi:solute carrier family 25, member 38